jgi:hypothetical protein
MGNPFITDLLMLAIIFATPVLIVWIVFLFQQKREQLRVQLIEKALELGKDIDPALLAAPVKEKKHRPNRLLATGVTLVSLGLAAFVSLFLLTELNWASLSSLLLFPGIGLLVVYALTRNKTQ